MCPQRNGAIRINASHKPAYGLHGILGILARIAQARRHFMVERPEQLFRQGIQQD